MTDGGVYTSHYFIKRLGRGQTEPLDLDFSYHLEPLDCAFQLGKKLSCAKAKVLQSPETAGETEGQRGC
jgi:hypothetical protein